MKEDRASKTAFLVQQGLLYTATRWTTAHLVADDSRDASVRLMARLPEGQRYLRQLESPFRLGVAVREWLLLPGVLVHFAVRKRWLEARVRRALADGARQVISLGAGFDTLALRLAGERDDLRLIEVDHPATQRVKAVALEGEEHGRRVDLLPVDFTRQTLLERLPQAPTFDAELSTVVICEGVLPYLDEREARTLFRSLRALIRGPGRVVFTFLGRRSPTGRQPYGLFLRAFLTFSGESMKLRCEPEELRGLLSEEGLRLDDVAVAPHVLESLGAHFYRGPLHDLEMLAEASFEGSPIDGAADGEG